MADHNLNVAECLKTVSDFGVNHIHNVCTGTVTDVPWGTVDWLACIGIGGFFGGMALLCIGFGVMVIRDSW